MVGYEIEFTDIGDRAYQGIRSVVPIAVAGRRTHGRPADARDYLGFAIANLAHVQLLLANGTPPGENSQPLDLRPRLRGLPFGHIRYEA
jgi:hypothetical protein